MLISMELYELLKNIKSSEIYDRIIMLNLDTQIDMGEDIKATYGIERVNFNSDGSLGLLVNKIFFKETKLVDSKYKDVIVSCVNDKIDNEIITLGDWYYIKEKTKFCNCELHIDIHEKLTRNICHYIMNNIMFLDCKNCSLVINELINRELDEIDSYLKRVYFLEHNTFSVKKYVINVRKIDYFNSFFPIEYYAKSLCLAKHIDNIEVKLQTYSENDVEYMLKSGKRHLIVDLNYISDYDYKVIVADERLYNALYSCYGDKFLYKKF